MTKHETQPSRLAAGAAAAAVALALQGCVATRDYVQEQNYAMSSRVSDNEARLAQLESQFGGRINTVEAKLNGVEGKLGTLEPQTQQALAQTARCSSSIPPACRCGRRRT
jgi:starvation-inducible outer membrane lipoprotein